MKCSQLNIINIIGERRSMLAQVAVIIMFVVNTMTYLSFISYKPPAVKLRIAATKASGIQTAEGFKPLKCHGKAH